ncbi:MAG TPA: type VI secretion system-associated FHA domain protein TagH, partial [Beijerinckiaceae bacterium]|nr:type VI secretion system-associated FHA domain protein TagH [Beijerinckiaceae bacterium]
MRVACVSRWTGVRPNEGAPSTARPGEGLAAEKHRMPLTLKIENVARLPDGGPLSVKISGKRGLDIGRDQHLDWTLPDPTRAISGKHCEVRYRDGGYWLHDVSTNGTFLNGSDRRMQGPHRLRHADRIEIGHYIIGVELNDEELAAPKETPVPAPACPESLWEPSGEPAPPADPKGFRPARELRPVRPEFLDWAIDTPGPSVPSPERPGDLPPPKSADDMAWAHRPAPPPVHAEAPPPIPAPRRPAMLAPAGNPWAQPDEDRAPVPGEPWGQLPSLHPGQELGAQPPGPRGPDPLPPDAHAAGVTSPAALPTPARSADFVSAFARGAGLTEDVFSWQDSEVVAEQIGALVRLVAEDLKQLLAARAASKRLARSSTHTTIQAVDNNPLKFSPTAEDALRLMFGRPTSGYLDAGRAFEQSFRELKAHQVKTYSAMQHALRMLVEDLDPQAIEEASGPGGA